MMTGHVHCISATECDRKWRSLLKTYRRHVDERKKTGRAGGKWVYFDVIDQILVLNASSVAISAAAGPKKPVPTVSSTDVQETGSGHPCRKKAKHGQPPEWFNHFVTEFRTDQAKRHKQLVTHLDRMEEIQHQRTNLLKNLVDKFSNP